MEPSEEIQRIVERWMRVRELVAHSGVEFTESREVELKGLDGAHRLYAVELTGP